MKKLVTSTFLVSLLLSSSIHGYAQEQPVILSQSVNTYNSLTLAKAIEKAFSDNHALTIMEYTWDMLDYQLQDTDSKYDDLDEVDSNITLPRNPFPEDPNVIVPTVDMNDLTVEQEKQIQAMINATMNAMTEAQLQAEESKMRKQIDQTNESLDNQKDQLVDVMKQININKEKNEIQQKETKKGIEAMITGQYIQLLNLKEQIKLQNLSLSTLQKDIQVAQLLLKYGMQSQENVTKLFQQERKLKDAVAKVEKTYKNQLSQFSLEINIPFDANIELKPIEVNQLPNDMTLSTDKIIEQSFAFQSLAKDLGMASYTLSRLDNDDPDIRYQYKQKELNVDIMEEKVFTLKKDLKKKIEAIYNDRDMALEDLVSKQENLKDEKDNHEKIKLRYENGFISKHDFEKSSSAIEQLDIEVQLAQYQYFIKNKMVEWMLDGYIQ